MPYDDPAKAAAWRAANRERLKAAKAADYVANAEAFKTRARARYAAQRDLIAAQAKVRYEAGSAALLSKLKATTQQRSYKRYAHGVDLVSVAKRRMGYAKTWKKANPGKVNASTQARRARQRNAVPPWADKRKTAAVYALAEFMTKITGDEYHVDHIVPLRGELVCGLHWHHNLQVLPAKENITKSNALIEELACAPST